jgi:hypothetical protein
MSTRTDHQPAGEPKAAPATRAEQAEARGAEELDVPKALAGLPSSPAPQP